jgi:hypothetical protein
VEAERNDNDRALDGLPVGDPAAGERTPDFRIVVLTHGLDLLPTTLPRCVEALTKGTSQLVEVVLYCDGTPPEVAAMVPELAAQWGVDEVCVRNRRRWVASGDPSNNGHQRFLTTSAPYLVVIEDDVVMYRTDPGFDVLSACRALFGRHPDVPVISKVDDHDKWAWGLEDVGPPISPGIRSVNRLSAHFVAYDVARFRRTAERFGAFEPDVFVDREDWSYNWEDLVSHVGTTGGRRIAFAEGWPLHVFHCDVKVAPGSMHHTQDPAVKADVLAELEVRFRPAGGSGTAGA